MQVSLLPGVYLLTMLQSLGLLGLCLLLVFAFSFACLCLGSIAGVFFCVKTEFAQAFSLGHLLLCLLLQGMAIFGVFSRVSLAVVFVVLGIAYFWKIHPGPSWKEALKRYRPADFYTWAFAFLIVAVSAFIFMCSLSYPQTDALAYYMAQPKLIAATGAYTIHPLYTTFSVLSLIAEMPFAVMYAVAGELWGQAAAKMSMYPVFLGVLVLLWDIARKLGMSRGTAWIATALGVTSTAITLVAWDGKTDLIALLYALGALSLMLGLTDSEEKHTSGLAFCFGMLSAGAVLAKFSYALVLPFCLGVPLLALGWKKKKQFVSLCLVAGAAALFVFCLGWWGKNALLFHDPFAPLFYLHEATPAFNLDQVWFGEEETRWIVATYSLAATFGLYPMQHGGISPIWLMLLPALAVRPWRNESGRKALWIAVGGLLGLAAWVCLRPSVIAPRYFLPALMWPCFLLLSGLDVWVTKRAAFLRLFAAALIVLLLLNLTYVYKAMRTTSAPYLRGLFTQRWDRIPPAARAQRLLADAEKEKCLVLSYSTENLPAGMLKSFVIWDYSAHNIYAWAQERHIKYIVHDAITHTIPALDEEPPPGLSVEKLGFGNNAYQLFILTPENSRTEGTHRD